MAATTRKYREQTNLGVIGTSKKVDEHRVPIHPEHLRRLPESVRRRLIFEEGYGKRFELTDAEIAEQSGGIATRHELLAELGAVILTKSPLFRRVQYCGEAAALLEEI